LTLHVFDHDLPGDRARALLDWCIANGADAFSVGVIECLPRTGRFGADLVEKLARFAIPAHNVRQIPDGEPGAYWAKVAQVWRLTTESGEVLWSALDARLLSYFPAGDAWCENPVLFRRGEIMLGIISHEHEGVLRVKPHEVSLLEAAGIAYRTEGKWVDY
jgi:hypothetical protein